MERMIRRDSSSDRGRGFINEREKEEASPGAPIILGRRSLGTSSSLFDLLVDQLRRRRRKKEEEKKVTNRVFKNNSSVQLFGKVWKSFYRSENSRKVKRSLLLLLFRNEITGRASGLSPSSSSK